MNLYARCDRDVRLCEVYPKVEGAACGTPLVLILLGLMPGLPDLGPHKSAEQADHDRYLKD